MRWIVPLVFLLGLFAFTAYVWPTRFRFDHMTVEGNIVLVRVDRFTGDADMLLPDDGWVPVESAVDSTGAAAPAVLGS
jgi:hypothetical protein